MAFSLVYWMKAGGYSVVESETVVGDRNVGGITYVMYKHKPYEARLLRQSDDGNSLAGIKVTSDGFIVEYDVSVALANNNAVEGLKKITATERKSQETLKKGVKAPLLPKVYDKTKAATKVSEDSGVQGKKPVGKAVTGNKEVQRCETEKKLQGRKTALDTTETDDLRLESEVQNGKKSAKEKAGEKQDPPESGRGMKLRRKKSVPVQAKETGELHLESDDLQVESDEGTGVQNRKKPEEEKKEKQELPEGRTGKKFQKGRKRVLVQAKEDDDQYRESDEDIEVVQKGKKGGGRQELRISRLAKKPQGKENKLQGQDEGAPFDFQEAEDDPNDAESNENSESDETMPEENDITQSSSEDKDIMDTSGSFFRQMPVPSEETISFMESLTTWWRGQSLDNTMAGSCESSQPSKQNAVIEEKVPLLGDYPNVLISRRRKNFYTKLYKKKPYVMATKLLACIIPTSELKFLKARGKGTAGIPVDTMEAVENYVALHSPVSTTSKKMTKAINNFTQELKGRGSHKKPTEKGSPQKSPQKPAVNPAVRATSPWKVSPRVSVHPKEDPAARELAKKQLFVEDENDNDFYAPLLSGPQAERVVDLSEY